MLQKIFNVFLLLAICTVGYIAARTHNMSVKTFHAKNVTEEKIVIHNKGNPMELVNTRYSFPMLISRLDGHISDCIRKQGTYQPEVLTALTHFVKKGNNILHFGTNQGLADMILALLVGDEGKIYSFEANPELYDIARKNFVLNNFDNIITLYNLAVSDKEGEKEFCFNYGNSGGGAFYGIQSPDKCFKANLIDVDSVIDQNTHIDILFMDIEGSEINAMEGAKKLMSNSKNMVIIMEWSPKHMIMLGSDVKKFIRDQLDQGKRFFAISDDDGVKYTEMTEKDLLDARCDLVILPSAYKITEELEGYFKYVAK